MAFSECLNRGEMPGIRVVHHRVAVVGAAAAQKAIRAASRLVHSTRKASRPFRSDAHRRENGEVGLQIINASLPRECWPIAVQWAF